MTRLTIDYGIDLGTTNSAVAVLAGTTTQIVKNNVGADVTPSAVHVDKAGRVHVGLRAKSRAEQGQDMAATEFKQRMGLRDQPTRFEPSGRVMEPEELSAEVLKSLRQDVRQQTGEDIDAAVITVPAAFELNQTDATRRAAELAGLAHAPLIQEPTAAAFAHGYQSDADNEFWLVYDLGGGTFDAAVVQLRDSEFTVVDHAGDNHLGGKQIDWAIVEQLFIPAAVRDLGLAGLARGAPEWRGAVGKLKHAAEEAKIELSRAEAVLVEVPELNVQDRHGRVDFEYELTRDDLARVSEPVYDRSIRICRRALAEARLSPADLAKVVLVGGPTLAPQLRNRLAGELGVELDTSQDPLTVVARGAAVFAGTQRLPHDRGALLPRGGCTVELDYSSMGTDPEPWVGGRVRGDDLPAGLTVEIRSVGAHPWSSGAMAVGPEGTFVTQLWAESGENTYELVVADGAGRPLDVTPDRLVYRMGRVESQPLLASAVGLGLAGNEMLVVVPKGAPLPISRTEPLRTVVDVRPGSDAGMIRIPVLSGERPRADRNRRVGMLEVTARDVARLVPAGSDVEVTVTVDASHLVHANAFVPLLDEEFSHVVDLAHEVAPDLGELEDAAARVKERYEGLRLEAGRVGGPDARALLDRVESDGLVRELNGRVVESAVDPSAAPAAAREVGNLEAILDDVEDALHWPQLVEDAERLLEEAGSEVRAAGDPAAARRFDDLEREARAAINAHDAHRLRQRCDDLRVLVVRLMHASGELVPQLFVALRTLVPEMTDPVRAARLVDEGEQALLAGRLHALDNVNRQLRALLPLDTPASDLPDWDATVRRGW